MRIQTILIPVKPSMTTPKLIQISRKETVKNLKEKLCRIFKSAGDHTTGRLWKLNPNDMSL